MIMKASHVLTVLGSLFASVTEANALITVVRCEIRGFEKPMFITEYSDGTPHVSGRLPALVTVLTCLETQGAKRSLLWS